MLIKINTQRLLASLKSVVGVTENKQTMPVLSNILFEISPGRLRLTATDLEVQVLATTPVDAKESIKTTLNGKKLFDIIKSFEEAEEIEFNFEGTKTTISSGKSKFTLTEIDAEQFPVMEHDAGDSKTQIDGEKLYSLFNQTAFSMAHQDARHYLNGLYLVSDENKITAVATDGHRLAISQKENNNKQSFSAIIPRKCVLELKRILTTDKDNKEKLTELSCNNRQISFTVDNFLITSKLIEGSYPEYKKVIPENLPNKLLVDRKAFKSSLQKMAILSNEQYRGVRLTLNNDELKLAANNPSQEEGEDLIACDYTGPLVEIGFNVSYLVEALDALQTERVCIKLNNSDSGCLITSDKETSPQYVIMPMRV